MAARGTIYMSTNKYGHTEKDKRQARHIESSEKKRGLSAKSAKRIAFATVNKQKSGKKKRTTSSKKAVH